MKSAATKIDIEKVVSECRKIAARYIADWKPTNPDWDVVDGCIYIRLSTDEQVRVEKGSMEQQIHLLVAEVESRSRQDNINYRITRVFIEPGVSGQESERKEFLALKRAVKTRQFGFVGFKEIARIARNSKIWEDFFRLCQEVKCKVIIRGLPIDPNDPAQILQLSILAAFAQYEAQNTAKRIRDSTFSAMVTSGKFNSTHRILGFDALVEDGRPRPGFYMVNCEEMATVKKIMQLFTQFNSHRKTLEYCREHGITNKDGRPLERNGLMSMLKNTKYIGKWVLNEENKAKNQNSLPPEERYQEVELKYLTKKPEDLVPLPLWNEVQVALNEARHMGKNTMIRRVFPLSGLLQHEDGTAFHGFSGTGRTKISFYYRNAEHKTTIPVSLIEGDAARMVAGFVTNSTALQKAIQSAQAETADNIQFLEQHASGLRNAQVTKADEKKQAMSDLRELIKKGNSEEQSVLRPELLKDITRIGGEIAEFDANIVQAELQLSAIRKTSFSWKAVAEHAKRIQEIMVDGDPVTLKAAYRAFFSRIVIGPEDEMGRRKIRYVLKGNPDDGEDTRVWDRTQMVEDACREPWNCSPVFAGSPRHFSSYSSSLAGSAGRSCGKALRLERT